MFAVILTWIGALLGIAVITAMALGGLGIDFDAARNRTMRRWRRVRREKEAPLG